MPTWAWILIAVGAIVFVVGVVLANKRARDRQLEQSRAEASELRQEAEERYSEAGRREAVAEQEALRARREREAADEALRRAEDVDPDVDLEDAEPDDETPTAREAERS
jgi:flagellar biosynthesis/type III secretory pathway M-ring protein FliF/YscJ